MSPDEYCRSKVALPGSSLYYSVLFVAPDLRDALVALHALADELAEIAYGGAYAGTGPTHGRGDEGVARTRIGWWGEELARMTRGEARHPVTRALGPHLAGIRVDAHRFADPLEAAGEQALAGAGATLEALEDRLARMAELTGCLAAELCGCRDPDTPEISRALGAGLALTDILHGSFAGGRPPCAALDAASAAGRADRLLSGYLADLPRADRASQRPRRALAEMALARLARARRAGFAGPPVAVTPLRKLWIAWKHRRP